MTWHRSSREQEIVGCEHNVNTFTATAHNDLLVNPQSICGHKTFGTIQVYVCSGAE